jgi:uncharacterized protein YbaR (Trm112 family)/ubiquinone/menaquinone biosynthesis C-methylase UbiE
MKPRLLTHLACPIRQTALRLIEWESHQISLTDRELARAANMGITSEGFEREVRTGVLVNDETQTVYPIHEGVPRMLVFRSAVHEAFWKQHSARMQRELPGYSFPDETGMPGEADVCRSFSAEWVDYDWDDESYWGLKTETMFDCMRFVLDLDEQPLKDQLVLEVGIGIGGIADYVTRTEQCETVGLDVSYAVDPAQRTFGNNPFFHPVQASAFAPPFRRETFDFVYSQGVLHHTFSTKTAFEAISQLPKIGGRLYVWVYSPYDESRTLGRQAMMVAENIYRPVSWRLHGIAQTAALLPLVPLYMLKQFFFRPKIGGIRYGWREALHAARDRFTPRYIHRHPNEEVVEWFNNAGYERPHCLSDREAPAFVPIAFTACTGVDGVRAA